MIDIIVGDYVECQNKIESKNINMVKTNRKTASRSTDTTECDEEPLP